MKKPVFSLKLLGYIAAGLVVVFLLLPMAGNIFSFIYFTSAVKARDKMGLDAICSELMKGDLAAASARIVRKKDVRKFDLGNAIVWLAGKGGNGSSPYVTIPKSPMFTDLPPDQGQLVSCRQQSGHSLTGGELYTEIYLNYPASMVRVQLRYDMSLATPHLQYINIYPPEPAGPPEDLDKKMGGFAGKLDKMEAEAKVEAAAAAAPPAAPLKSSEPRNTAKGFISRYGCLFPLPQGYEGDSRFSDKEKDIELVMLYPKGTKERAWTAMDKVQPPVIAIELVPLRSLAKDPAYIKKTENGLEQVMVENDWKFTTSELKSAQLKGYVTKVADPSHVRVRLYGKDRIYKFTSELWDARLQAVVNGFRETAE